MIDLAERVLDATAANDGELPERLITVSSALSRRYRQFGNLADLDRAITGCERALTATSPQDPKCPHRLIMLGELLTLRFDRSGDPADLDRAVRTAEDGLAACPEAERASGLESLAGALHSRYLAFRDLDDLVRGIAMSREAVNTSPIGLRIRTMRMNQLSVLLYERYRGTGDAADLDRAVNMARQVVYALPDPDPMRAAAMNALTWDLRERFIREDQTAQRRADDVMEAITMAARGMAAALGDPLQLARCAAGLSQVLMDGAPGIGTMGGTLDRIEAQITQILAGTGLESTLPAGLGVMRWIPAVVELALEKISVLGAVAGPSSWEAALASVQGLASLGAYIAASLGDLRGALALIENGSAVLAGARIGQQDAVLSALEQTGHRDVVAEYGDALAAVSIAQLRGEMQADLVLRLERARADVERSWGASLMPRADAGELARLVAHAPLTYLVVTGVAAMTLTVTADPDAADGLRIVPAWIDGLSSDRVTGWVETLHGRERAKQATDDDTRGFGAFRGVETGAARADHDDGESGVWRAIPAAMIPSPPGVVGVVEELAGVLAPVLPTMTGDGTMARVVPVGATAMLPVAAAINRLEADVAVSVSGSAKLHLMTMPDPARTRRRDENRTARPGERPWLVAVTNAHVSTWQGKVLPLLPSASREGNLLHHRYGALHLDGPAATRRAVLTALEEPGVRAVHLATHGDVPSWDRGAAHIILTDPDDGAVPVRAESLTIADLPALMELDCVFLASCWTGSPAASLPDEVQSLPTGFITSGAKAVIAPLWPVDDRASKFLVGRYYSYWTDGLPPVRALTRAACDTRAEAIQMNANCYREAEASAWYSTADAFTVTGGTC